MTNKEEYKSALRLPKKSWLECKKIIEFLLRNYGKMHEKNVREYEEKLLVVFNNIDDFSELSKEEADLLVDLNLALDEDVYGNRYRDHINGHNLNKDFLKMFLDYINIMLKQFDN